MDAGTVPEQDLARRVRALGAAVVGFSGGVDSALLAAVAVRELGGRALAVTGVSPAVPESEVASARALARRIGIAFQVVRTRELEDPRYAANPVDRCAFCKTELMRWLAPLAAPLRARVVLGVNADDLLDWRPGQKAAREAGAVFPLADAGLGKAAVRDLARSLGLEVWDKPAQPCLASRIPYGQAVTAGKLARVEAAEALLRAEGFRDCRVRHHEDRASVEVPASELPGLLEPVRWARIESELLALGFPRVEAEPEGLRSGRLNDAVAGR